jgi:hypothetical protein
MMRDSCAMLQHRVDASMHALCCSDGQHASQREKRQTVMTTRALSQHRGAININMIVLSKRMPFGAVVD